MEGLENWTKMKDWNKFSLVSPNLGFVNKMKECCEHSTKVPWKRNVLHCFNYCHNWLLLYLLRMPLINNHIEDAMFDLLTVKETSVMMTMVDKCPTWIQFGMDIQLNIIIGLNIPWISLKNKDTLQRNLSEGCDLHDLIPANLRAVWERKCDKYKNNRGFYTNISNLRLVANFLFSIVYVYLE